MRPISPVLLTLALAGAPPEPTRGLPVGPDGRHVPDDEYAALQAKDPSTFTTVEKSKALIGNVERELARLEHYDPRTGARLYTVLDVLACLRDHGSVTIQQPGLPAPVAGEEAPTPEEAVAVLQEAVDGARTPAPQILDPVNAPLSAETVSAALGARDGLCGFTDCPEQAVHAPVLLIRSMRSPNVHRVELPVGLCQGHGSTRIDSYLTESGWQNTVCAPLNAAGFRPARHLSTVKLFPLAEA